MSCKTQNLQVVALVSGGKDSLYTISHCIANGHDVAALANLYPAPASSADFDESLNAGEDLVTRIDPGDVEDVDLRSAFAATGQGIRVDGNTGGQFGQVETRDTIDQKPSKELQGGEKKEDEEDTNSYMYQTIGHALVPLYAGALNLPLYRRPIFGGATNTSSSYHHRSHQDQAWDAYHSAISTDPSFIDRDANPQEEDETESLIPLLRHVLHAHPHVNAVCTGAILSTYQRTRVESVAARLGLVSVGWLWMYPYLPSPYGLSSSSLLHDMRSAGLEARIIKISTGGLSTTHLMSSVTSSAAIMSLGRAMSRFGPLEVGALLGEGGEFETLCLDGPGFVKRIEVFEGDWKVVSGEGGVESARIERARLVDKGNDGEEGCGSHGGAMLLPVPRIWDPRFDGVVRSLSSRSTVDENRARKAGSSLEANRDEPVTKQLPNHPLGSSVIRTASTLSVSNLTAPQNTAGASPVSAQMTNILQTLTSHLQIHSIPRTSITSTLILLRQISDFANVNKVYSSYFSGFPNPPARVTVAVGDSLPEGVDVSLSVVSHLRQPRHKGTGDGPEGSAEDDRQQNANAEDLDRKALHVQSRSYWAPANIGPYSQAVSAPLSKTRLAGEAIDGDVNDDNIEQIIVHMAGQIPLVPSTMDLLDKSHSYTPELPALGVTDVAPEGGRGNELFIKQAALSLQHLWRVARAMNVFYFAGGIAYLANTSPTTNSIDTTQMAETAARTWCLAHASPLPMDTDHDCSDGEEDEEKDDVDIAELSLYSHSHSFPRHQQQNPESSASNTSDNLPDYSRISTTINNSSSTTSTPTLIIPLISQLPRSATIEWTAWGFAHPYSTSPTSPSVQVSRNRAGSIWITYDSSSKHLILCAGIAGGAEFEEIQALLDFLLRSEGSGDEKGDAKGQKIGDSMEWLPREILSGRQYETANAEVYLPSPQDQDMHEQAGTSSTKHNHNLLSSSAAPAQPHSEHQRSWNRLLNAAAIIPCARVWYASGVRDEDAVEGVLDGRTEGAGCDIKECKMALRCHFLPV